MIEHTVEDDPHVVLVNTSDECVHILHGAHVGIDGTIVADVIAKVVIGGRENWTQPQNIDPKIFEIGNLLYDSREVTDTISTRI